MNSGRQIVKRSNHMGLQLLRSIHPACITDSMAQGDRRGFFRLRIGQLQQAQEGDIFQAPVERDDTRGHEKQREGLDIQRNYKYSPVNRGDALR